MMRIWCEAVNGKQWTTAPVPNFRPSGRDAAPMAWVFAVMLVGLLPGCAQFEAQKEREALDATVAMAANDDELCRSHGASRAPYRQLTPAARNAELRGLPPEPLEPARCHHAN